MALNLRTRLKPLEVQIQAVQLQGHERPFDRDLRPQSIDPTHFALNITVASLPCRTCCQLHPYMDGVYQNGGRGGRRGEYTFYTVNRIDTP